MHLSGNLQSLSEPPLSLFSSYNFHCGSALFRYLQVNTLAEVEQKYGKAAVKQVRDQVIKHYRSNHRGKCRDKIWESCNKFLGVVSGSGLYDTERAELFLAGAYCFES